jgi:hypothetical protein
MQAGHEALTCVGALLDFRPDARVKPLHPTCLESTFERTP